MTLCIAAICTHNGQPAIVLCSDWRTESGDVAGGDVQDKLAWLVPKKWATLKAGPIADADKLAAVIGYTFQQATVSLTGDTIGPVLDQAMQRYRWMLIDHFLQARLGIDYVALVGGMKVLNDPERSNIMLPEAFVNEKLHEVETVPVPACFLIVAGFAERTPVVCVLNEPPDGTSWARTRFESNFAAIGSGAPAALISLYRREHIASDVPLMKAIYHVFEAKLVGEVSPGVGAATSITVLLPNGQCWDLSAKGHAYIGERYDYFGPMRFRAKRPKLTPPFFVFKEEYFEPYKFPWEDQPKSAINSPRDQT